MNKNNVWKFKDKPIKNQFSDDSIMGKYHNDQLLEAFTRTVADAYLYEQLSFAAISPSPFN